MEDDLEILDTFDSLELFDGLFNVDSSDNLDIEKPTDVLLSNEELLSFINEVLPDLLPDKVCFIAFYLSGFYANTYGTLDNYPDYLIADNFVINNRIKDDMRSKSIILQTNFKETWSTIDSKPFVFNCSQLGFDDDLQNYLSEVAKQVDESSWASLVTTVRGFSCYKDCLTSWTPFITQEAIMLDLKKYYDFY